VCKRLSGANLDQRLGPKCCVPAVNAGVYRALRQQARHALRSDHAATVDAVHARPEERAAIEEVVAAAQAAWRSWLAETQASVSSSARPARANISSISDSLMMSGGQKAIESWTARTTTPCSWACTLR